MVTVGFGARDITPVLGKTPVYMAGFGKNRKATGVHDPLMARAIVLADKDAKVAIVSVDVVGLFHPFIEKVRRRLPGFTYVLISSTHNHEGPDTLGLWGPNSLQTGVDGAYMTKVADAIVSAVTDADQTRRSAQTRIGTAKAPELLHDGRLPIVKHDELVALHFVEGVKNVGILVQWNCHPETLGSQNTQVSADFVAATVAYLSEKYHCPVVYLTGTVGGLMTSLGVPVKDEHGKSLSDGTFVKTERYGRLVGALAHQAVGLAKPVRLSPLQGARPWYFCPWPIHFINSAGSSASWTGKRLLGRAIRRWPNRSRTSRPRDRFPCARR